MSLDRLFMIASASLYEPKPFVTDAMLADARRLTAPCDLADIVKRHTEPRFVNDFSNGGIPCTSTPKECDAPPAK